MHRCSRPAVESADEAQPPASAPGHCCSLSLLPNCNLQNEVRALQVELRCREDLEEVQPPDPEPVAVAMGVQAGRHLRWLAPRLTAVRELSLVDWVRRLPWVSWKQLSTSMQPLAGLNIVHRHWRLPKRLQDTDATIPGSSALMLYPAAKGRRSGAAARADNCRGPAMHRRWHPALHLHAWPSCCLQSTSMDT